LEEENKAKASIGLALIILFFSKLELDCLKLVKNIISSAGGLKKNTEIFKCRKRKPLSPAARAGFELGTF